MRVLSLFDGIGGARKALKNLEVVPEIYCASEVNPHAIKVAKDNFPYIRELGDINKLDIDFLRSCKFDLMVFGSPCTDLSIARKNRQSLAGKSSGLFYKAVEILEAVRPKYFLMENVASMSEESKQEISGILGVNPIQVNSRIFTGQNRERLYWHNWISDDYQPAQPVWFRDRLMNFGPLLAAHGKNLTISQAGKEYMLRKTADGRDHYDFGHHSDTDKPFSACVVSNFKKGVPYNVLLDRRDHQTGCWIRRFHPNECERLQGFPDYYSSTVPWTHRYEMIGNAFTVPVIQHFLQYIV